MPVREDQNVAGNGTDLGENTVDARGDVVQRLPSGNAVAPERPAGKLLADLDGRPSLISAVVPLYELVPRNCTLAKARQPTCLQGALERARQDEIEPTRPEL